VKNDPDLENLEAEIPLSGGNMNRVVRVGTTVRRLVGPQSPQIHALLQHLRAKGFTGAPEFFGIDTQGREILGFVEGVLSLDSDPRFLWRDQTLIAAAQMLRRYHDAQTGLVMRADAQWNDIGREPIGPAEVLCHNDFTPYNSICREDQLVSMIDFDLVAPGSRAWDLAWSAVNWIPLFDPVDHPRLEPEPAESRRKLALICEAYGFEEPPLLVDAILRRMQHLLAVGQMKLAAGDAWAVRTAEHRPFWERVSAFVHRNAEGLA
jgi:hypothetical protein